MVRSEEDPTPSGNMFSAISSISKEEATQAPKQDPQDPIDDSAQGLRENTLDHIAPRFGPDLDGTIEKHPRHSTAMVRVFRLRSVQRGPEDWMRYGPRYFLSGPHRRAEMDSSMVATTSSTVKDEESITTASAAGTKGAISRDWSRVSRS